jgi:hypothetical protein
MIVPLALFGGAPRSLDQRRGTVRMRACHEDSMAGNPTDRRDAIEQRGVICMLAAPI